MEKYLVNFYIMVLFGYFDFFAAYECAPVKVFKPIKDKYTAKCEFSVYNYIFHIKNHTNKFH